MNTVETQTKALLRAYSEHPVAYFPVYAEIAGSVSAGVLLAQLLYWWGIQHEKEFYKTDQEFADELAMGVYELRGSRKKLVEAGLITTARKGLPRRMHYIVHEDRLVALITSVRQNPTLESGKTQHRSEVKPNTIVETTAETTHEITKNMQREKTAPPSPKKKRSLKGLSRDEVIAVYKSNRQAPAPGLTRPQVLAAILDHTQGFDQIIKREGWSTVMMRLGQVFNARRKVQPEYRDVMDVAISWGKIPKPRGGLPSLNYLIAALTKEAVECMEDRLEGEAQEHKYGVSEAIDGVSESMRARPRRSEA